MSEDPIFRSEEDGLWYFWDETWSHKYGPFFTRPDAEEALDRYCKELLWE